MEPSDGISALIRRRPERCLAVFLPCKDIRKAVLWNPWADSGRASSLEPIMWQLCGLPSGSVKILHELQET